jgi:nitrate reductase NapE component
MDTYAILWKIAYEVCLMIGITIAWVNGFITLSNIAKDENERAKTKLRTIFYNIIMMIILSVGVVVEFVVWCYTMDSLKGL